jgi:hypothetical protein
MVQWPLAYIFTNLRPLAFFVARPGFFVLPTWLAAAMMYLVVRLYCGSENLSLLSGLKGRGWIVFASAFAMFLLSFLYTSPSDTASLLIHTVDPLSLFWVGAQSLLSLALARWRGRSVGLRG